VGGGGGDSGERRRRRLKKEMSRSAHREAIEKLIAQMKGGRLCGISP